MEVFKPNMYVTLSFSGINSKSSHSAIEKSVNITNRLFKSCLERHHQSEVNAFFKLFRIIVLLSWKILKYIYFS